MRIVVGVVGHQSRHNAAFSLGMCQRAAVCNIDDGTLRCEGNHVWVLSRLALLDADWCVVLEDDARPIGGFRSELKAALVYAPAPIVGLYLGTGNPSGEVQRRIRQAVIGAQAWILADCLIGSVGYAVRGPLMAELVDGIAAREEELPLRISRWAQDRGELICYTVPSLVDHADDVPIGHDGAPRPARRAWRYGVRGGVGWDTPTVELGYCPNWSKEQQTRE